MPLRVPQSRRFRRNLAIGLGAGLGLAVLGVLLAPGREALHARGPMNTGHSELNCADCHEPAPGTLRQQIQANTLYALGGRETPADFGVVDVGSAQCLACHERPDNRHPVFRFFEPRFAEAREALHPESCVSCHTEHKGRRVTVDTTGFCEHCHDETQLKNDPVDISHAELVEQERWETCLGCHDFHGNHKYEVSTRIADVFGEDAIRAYFDGGPSPYGDDKRVEPLKELAR